MKNELKMVLQKNIGIKCFEMQYFINRLIEKGRLKAFSAPEGKSTFEQSELQKADRIDERLPYILQDRKTKENYTINMESHSGVIHNDGDSQTLYYSCTIKKLKYELPLEMEVMHHGVRFHIPEDNMKARLEMSYSDDWEAHGEKDDATSSSASTKVFGENDKFFNLILKYMEKRV